MTDDLARVGSLAMMLRRMIWCARKETGDTSMKALAGQASELLARHGLNGSPFRNNPKALPCEECGQPRFEIGILVCRECWNNLHERGPAFGASLDR